MKSETLYSLLKVVSLLASGAFGVLALLTKYKDDHDKITRWGKIAIGGILVSSGISLALYSHDASKAEDAAKAAEAEAIKRESEAEATKQKLEIIVANATATAQQQKISLEQTEKLKSGLEESKSTLEESLKTSNDIVKSMKQEGEAAERRYNQLLGGVERTVHPLFPLEVKVIYRAPLSDNTTSAFRQTLEAQLKAAKKAAELRDQDVDILGLKPENEFYPSRDSEPLGYGIVTADLDTWIRFYTKEKTKHRNFTEDDLNFCYCPLRNVKLSPNSEDPFGEFKKLELSRREIYFDPQEGLRFDQGIDKIDLSESNVTPDFVSADDLYGATIQIEARPFINVYRKYGRVANDLIILEGVEINLPGNRRLWIRGDRFSKTADKDRSLYRFTFPTSRVDFDKLLSDI